MNIPLKMLLYNFHIPLKWIFKWMIWGYPHDLTETSMTSSEFPFSSHKAIDPKNPPRKTVAHEVFSGV